MGVKRILNWTINSINGSGQEVYRSIDGGEYSLLSELGAAVTEYVDEEDVLFTTSINYRVESVGTVNGVVTRAASTNVTVTA